MSDTKRVSLPFLPRLTAGLGALALAIGATLLMASGGARAQVTTPFDHLTTGFELIGQHRDLPCESCHVNAIFKGTPRDCAACHGVGTTVRATAKPVSHILSSERCEACHTPVAWSPAVNFDHAEVRGSCSSCHNGVQAQGKGPGHLDTSLECNLCHTTIGWAGVIFTHSIVTTDCARCHNGSAAKGAPAMHIPTGTSPNPADPGNAACELCHAPTNYVTFAGTAMNHQAVTPPMLCATCHEAGNSFFGVSFQTRPPPPHPTTASGDCGACHTSTVSWQTGALMPAGHIPTTQPCTLCHANPADYKQYTMSHAGISNGCATCHAGQTFATNFVPTHPSATHINFASATCESCHSSSAFDTFRFPQGNASGPAPPAMVHAAVGALSCASCHAPGAIDSGMPATKVEPPEQAGGHIPTGTAACTSCHSATDFATFVISNASPTPMNHAVVTSACTTCHEAGKTDIGSVPKPTVVRPPLEGNGATHPKAGECSDCHTGFTNFLNATNYPSNHIPLLNGSSTNCSTCHTDPNSFSTAVMGANHSLVTSVCETCHAGQSFANVAPKAPPTSAPKHIPWGSAACSSCHSATDFNSFVIANSSPSPMNHAAVASIACAMCHGKGLSWIGAPTTVVEPPEQPGGHIPIGSAACTACHSATSFGPGGFIIANASGNAPPAMVHSAVSGISCATCHGRGLSWVGGGTVVEPAEGSGGHIPIGSAACTGCHSATVFTTPGGFKINNTSPAPMNHAVVTSDCIACHEAGRTDMGTTPKVTVVRPLHEVAADPNSPLHVTSGQCSTCHTKFTDFLGATNYPSDHIPVPAADNGNCAICHRTPGNYSVATMDAAGHANITSNCAQCHAFGLSFANMAAPALKQPPANHIPSNRPSGSQDIACESCHSPTNFATFMFNNVSGTIPAMVHSAVSGMACVTCHGKGLSWVGTPATKVEPAEQPSATGHIPIGSAACTACHSATVFTSFVIANTSPAPMNHAAVASIACVTCHGKGVTWVGTPATKVEPPEQAGGHIPIGSAACTSCHAAANFTTFVIPNTSPTPMNHAVVSSACSTCHEAGKTDIGKSPKVTVVRPALKADKTAHVPGGECSTCHTKFTDFLGATDLPANHIPIPAADKNNCAICHTTPGNYSVAVMGTTGHVNITNNCMQCHAYGLSFANMAPPTLVQPPAGATGHIPTNPPNATTQNFACELCHLPTVFTSFAGTVMKHAPVRGMTCMSCHELGMKWKTNTGVRLWVRDGANHYKGQDCGGSGCHSARDKFAARRGGAISAAQKSGTVSAVPSLGAATALGRTASFNHRRVAGTACLSCHGPTSGIGKSPTHMATTDSCESCHMTTAWLPVTRVDHLQVKGSCVSCHDKTVARGKGSNHIASSDSCETCHTTNAWTPARFDHVGVAAHTCKSCHDALHAAGLPANHVPTAAECDTCHGTLGWKPAKLDHTTLTAKCASCHDNNIALGVSPTHMVTARDCVTCHSYPDWTVLHFVHAAASYPGDHRAAPACAACHTGNTDQIAWAAPADAGSCAGCHAKDFKPDLHPKTLDGLKYTASELRDCSGACHVYSDSTLGTVSKSVPGPYHRVTDAAFKH